MNVLTQILLRHTSPTTVPTRLLSSFKFADLQLNLTDSPIPKTPHDELVFGHTFSDHMLEIDWTQKHGWGPPVIKPTQDLRIHPAAKVFHYACELYEGLKAYHCVDHKVRIFRPMENMTRMHLTAARTSLPTFDKFELLKCVKKLVAIDHEWVPHSPSCSLYIRPTFIGTEGTLGICAPNMAKIFVLLSPVGPYFATGLKPVTLLAEPKYVRAWPGGCGSYKMGSNYAPTVAIQAEAAKLGCQQVLWLYGHDHEMTEVGTMNLFVHWINEEGEEELITPSLESGLILHGITRKSMVELAREWDEFKVTEGKITMPTFVKALKDGRIKEVFGSGTACVVCPVNKILYLGEKLVIGDGGDDTGPLAQRFYDEINDIHYYRKPHDWMESLATDCEDARQTLES